MTTCYQFVAFPLLLSAMLWVPKVLANTPRKTLLATTQAGDHHQQPIVHHFSLSGRTLNAGKNKIEQDYTEEMAIQRAWMSSALVPGWGQIYNGHYAKVPAIYALFLGLGGGAFYNHSYYKEFKDKNDPNYQVAADTHRMLRDLFVIFMGMVYLGNVVDAYAGATLKTFDLSDNISVALEPCEGMASSKCMGLGVSINIR